MILREAPSPQKLGDPASSRGKLNDFFRPGSDFFGHPKDHQKPTSQKTYFCRLFLSHLAKISKNTSKSTVILGPPWGHFSMFFQNSIFSCFLTIFRWKNKQMKKWKSRFRYVNYSVSLGSPGWQKRENLQKITLNKKWFFSWQIDPKSSQKTELNEACYKNRLKNKTCRTL